jgi:hypothetical protein
MTLRVRAFSMIPPSMLRPFVVRWLFRSTADAFGTPPPVLRGMSGGDLLRAYGAFSNARSEFQLRRGGDLEAVRRDLWISAHRVGVFLRRCLCIGTDADAMVAARAVYRVLDIDLRGSPAGEVVVARCSFARIYSPEVCALMSSLDSGLFAGLTGGRRLTFSLRLTEGAPACAATLTPPQEVAA